MKKTFITGCVAMFLAALWGFIHGVLVLLDISWVENFIICGPICVYFASKITEDTK
jgi:hypothetical protein